ncbi:hypothetical protein GCM10020221_24940 [Streptomyces thioluteus]|uniref:Aldehyde dehydrogenase domain-containing protein n=1 Tax=Streptomyces thioluteus TaxID=66431 RepID=A0ABN3WUG5_STRTU
MEEHLEALAVAESWENGKPIREALAADIPLAIDHFRYFAGALRAQEGSLSEIDEDTIAYHFHEPLGVVAQIIPWNFPLLMAAWKLAPALAAGNAVVLKPAEQTPASIHIWLDLVADLIPPGVVNVVNGFGVEAGKPLASSPRVAKIAFTGETTTGRLIMQYASENLRPVTLELGGKSPNIFFDDVSADDDDFLDKALEGFTMFASNQARSAPVPPAPVIQRGHYADFLARRRRPHRGDRPLATALDTATMIAPRPQTTSWRRSSPTSTSAARKAPASSPAATAPTRRRTQGGYYVEPTIFEGTNRMRVFQEEIFGRSPPSPPSPTSTRPSPSPTTPSTAWAPASGPATAPPPTAPAAPSRRAASGPTATTSTRPTPPSAATSSRASGGRGTR